MIENTQDAEAQLKIGMALINSKDPNSQLFGVNILEEKEVDGHKLWKYSFQGVAVPRTRYDQWLADDGGKYSIFGCFEHSIEQVVRGEVNGPHHTNEHDR